MQGKIFKVKIFEGIQKSSKSMKIFSLGIFRLYNIMKQIIRMTEHIHSKQLAKLDWFGL